MANNFIVTTDSTNLHIVSYQGVALCNCHRQIQDVLRNRLGTGAAGQLFAEPVVNSGEHSIDWYTDVPGRARPLADLSPEEQDRLKAEVASQVAAIRAVADALLASGDSASVTKGNILDKALTWPDDSCLYACNDQPVLVCGGCTGNALATVQAATIDRDAAVKAVAAATAAVPQAEPTPPPVVETPTPVEEPVRVATPVREEPKRRFGWWPLLLLVPLLLLLLWLLSRCTPQTADVPPATPVPPVVDAPVASAPDTAAGGEPLRIPENATDISFMRGVIRVVTPTVNEAGQRAILRVELNDRGQGTAFVDTGEQTCKGPVTAEYVKKDGLPDEVRVATERLQCPGEHYFEPILMVCRGQGELDCGLENKGRLIRVQASRQELQ